jgi:hypothetical protein
VHVHNVLMRRMNCTSVLNYPTQIVAMPNDVVAMPDDAWVWQICDVTCQMSRAQTAQVDADSEHERSNSPSFVADAVFVADVTASAAAQPPESRGFLEEKHVAAARKASRS